MAKVAAVHVLHHEQLPAVRRPACGCVAAREVVDDTPVRAVPSRHDHLTAHARRISMGDEDAVGRDEGRVVPREVLARGVSSTPEPYRRAEREQHEPAVRVEIGDAPAVRGPLGARRARPSHPHRPALSDRSVAEDADDPDRSTLRRSLAEGQELPVRRERGTDVPDAPVPAPGDEDRRAARPHDEDVASARRAASALIARRCGRVRDPVAVGRGPRGAGCPYVGGQERRRRRRERHPRNALHFSGTISRTYRGRS